MTPLAVALLLRDRRVLVVGAGPVALGKIARLLAAKAQVTIVAPDVLPEIHALAAAGTVQLAQRRFVPADLDGVWFCLTATGRDRVDGEVFAACEARHLLCNAADVPEACSVQLMAQEDAGSLTLAVGSAGLAPGLTGRLAREARAAWPDDIAVLVQRYGAIRQWLKAQHPGDALLPNRTAALRWLARQPWALLRRPEPDLREAVAAALQSEPPQRPR